MNPVYLIPGVLISIPVMFYCVFARRPRRKYEELPGQREAVDHIWHVIYGIKRYSFWNPWTFKNKPPSVKWMRGAELNYKGKAWTQTFNGKPMNLAGLASTDGGTVYVALPEGQTMAGSALAHELHHQALRLKNGHGDGDAEHKDEGFWDPEGPMMDATNYLKSKGL